MHRLIKKMLKADTQYGDTPHGWIQWKGTNVCMDCYCECGCRFHLDGDFGYHTSCPECGTLYSVGQNVKLIKMDEEDIKKWEADGSPCLLIDDDYGDLI